MQTKSCLGRRRPLMTGIYASHERTALATWTFHCNPMVREISDHTWWFYFALITCLWWWLVPGDAIWHWALGARLEVGCIFGAHLDPPSKPGRSLLPTHAGHAGGQYAFQVLWQAGSTNALQCITVHCVGVFLISHFEENQPNLKIHSSQFWLGVKPGKISHRHKQLVSAHLTKK